MMQASGQATALQYSIVKLLREYDQELPIGFVAQSLGRSAGELLPTIESMESLGLIKRKDGTIELLQKAAD